MARHKGWGIADVEGRRNVILGVEHGILPLFVRSQIYHVFSDFFTSQRCMQN
jgi:hypothetical protein